MKKFSLVLATALSVSALGASAAPAEMSEQEMQMIFGGSKPGPGLGYETGSDGSDGKIYDGLDREDPHYSKGNGKDQVPGSVNYFAPGNGTKTAGRSF